MTAPFLVDIRPPNRIIQRQRASRQPLVVELEAGPGPHATTVGAAPDLRLMRGGEGVPDRVVDGRRLVFFPPVARDETALHVHQTLIAGADFGGVLRVGPGADLPDLTPHAVELARPLVRRRIRGRLRPATPAS